MDGCKDFHGLPTVDFSKVRTNLRKLFFPEFPTGCLEYAGINPSHCYMSLWIISGCLDSGRGNPRFMSDEQIAQLYQYNIE